MQQDWCHFHTHQAAESEDDDDIFKRYRHKEYHNLVRKSVTKAKEMYEKYL